MNLAIPKIASTMTARKGTQGPGLPNERGWKGKEEEAIAGCSPQHWDTCFRAWCFLRSSDFQFLPGPGTDVACVIRPQRRHECNDATLCWREVCILVCITADTPSSNNPHLSFLHSSLRLFFARRACCGTPYVLYTTRFPI